MAEYFCGKIEIGDVVYEPYKPQNPGMVVEVENKTKTYKNGWTQNYILVTVDFLKTGIKKVKEINLANFNSLIADHEKKLNTHKTNLQKLINKGE